MKFVMHRNHVVASTSGHVIGFKKGEPTYVPPEARKDVMAAGGIPEDEDFDPDAEANAKKPPTDEPTDPAEREKAVFAVFEKLVVRGRREDFTANGVPNAKVLKAELGWELQPRDRDLFWEQFQQKGAAK
jgi:hypothetical protein